jgi:hypothetical protein
MDEVVRGLPVVEYLVAVLDRREEGGDDIDEGEECKCRARLQLWRLLRAEGFAVVLLASWHLYSVNSPSSVDIHQHP